MAEREDIFDARKHEKASTHQKEWGNQIIGQLELSGSERILDLGCGNGALTAQPAQRVPGKASSILLTLDFLFCCDEIIMRPLATKDLRRLVARLEKP